MTRYKKPVKKNGDTVCHNLSKIGSNRAQYVVKRLVGVPPAPFLAAASTFASGTGVLRRDLNQRASATVVHNPSGPILCCREHIRERQPADEGKFESVE